MARGAPEGALTEAQAGARMLELVRAHHVDETRLEADAGERRRRGLTFRELGQEWLHYLQYEKGVKPSTLVGYRNMLSESAAPTRSRQGAGPADGALRRPSGTREITTREVADFLRALERAGASARERAEGQRPPAGGELDLRLRDARRQPWLRAQPGTRDHPAP